MITVACVNVSDYLGRGNEYVEKLRSMVARNLSMPYRFECITEDEGRPGWWAKTLHFKPGRYSGRVIALDLDIVIVGPLDELAMHKGILHLTDWGWKTASYGSGVMVFDAGEHADVFKRYHVAVPRLFKGDQDWMTHIGGWPALPKGLNVSYRYHAKDGPPPGAVTVSMHGNPKPHEFAPDHWVSKAWY